MIILIWIISLIILLASIVFVYRMLITSNEFIAPDKIFPFKFLKPGSERKEFYRKSLTVLNSRIKSLEDSNAYYEMQFSILQSRISESTMDASLQQKPFSLLLEEEEEDWKELYYQENEQKVQLENDLDQALQDLAAKNQEIEKLKEGASKKAILNSKRDERPTELNSIQCEADTFQKKLTGAAKLENGVRILLNKEITLKFVNENSVNDNVRLRSEVEDQKRQLTEMCQKEKVVIRQLSSAKELQSHLGAMYEEKKKRKIMDLTNKMGKNKIFSDK